MTAEFAVALPAVVLVLALCLSAMQLCTQQVRLQDAASVAARSLARDGGEGGGTPAGSIVSALAPAASLSTERRGDLMCVSLRATRAVALFPGVVLTARSCSPASAP